MTDQRPTAIARERSPWSTLLTVAGCFAAGPVLGTSLAALVAPGSRLAEAIGFFVFGIAFLLGLYAWLGFAIVSAAVALARRLFAGGPSVEPAALAIPPGSFAFVPISTVAGLLAGLPVGFLSDTVSLVSGTMLFAAGGAAYGVVVWQLARAGFLPFPEPG